MGVFAWVSFPLSQAELFWSEGSEWGGVVVVEGENYVRTKHPLISICLVCVRVTTNLCQQNSLKKETIFNLLRLWVRKLPRCRMAAECFRFCAGHGVHVAPHVERVSGSWRWARRLSSSLPWPQWLPQEALTNPIVFAFSKTSTSYQRWLKLPNYIRFKTTSSP